MLSYTVYRGMNNEIVLQLLSNDDPLGDPDSVSTVRLGVRPLSAHLLVLDVQPFTLDSNDAEIDYDDSDGTLHMRLGLVADIMALPDGNYEIEVSAYGPENVEGIAFGAIQIYLREWSGELGS